MSKINNLKAKLIVTAIYLAYIFLRWSTVGIKCIFALAFGIPCPFCGMTRAFMSALRLEFASAFTHHAMFWSLPVLYLLLLYDGKIFNNKYANTAVWTVMCAGFLANWIYHIV